LPGRVFFTRVISLGPDNGLLCINGKVFDGATAAKAKKESLDIETQIFKGSSVAIKKSKDDLNKTLKVVKCATCCCCVCSPYSHLLAPPRRHERKLKMNPNLDTEN
jgi:hypothetical protein